MGVDADRYHMEVARVREAYARRDTSGKQILYSWWRPEVIAGTYTLHATIARLLRDHGRKDLTDMRALDVGCGAGAWLSTLSGWGATRANLAGVDLLEDRIASARALLPDTDLRVASGWALPFESASFDLTSAFTVLSSILDPVARAALAAEMLRVTKREGLALVYDFRVKRPSNQDVVPVDRREVRRLFPECRVWTRTTTLAPPISRRIATAAPTLALALEALFPPLRTHAVHVVRKEN